MPTIEQAHNWYPDEDGVHGFAHVLRVYHLAERLARAENADLEIVRAAALLHDIDSSQLAGNPYTRQQHHQASADFAGQVLAQEGWPAARIIAGTNSPKRWKRRFYLTPTNWTRSAP